MNNKEIYNAKPEVIDEQVRNYFFNKGYINKKNNLGFNDVLEEFIKEHPKIINNHRTDIARNAYDDGKNKIFE